MQIVDGYTFNIKIISPRTSGSWEADSYIITGPSHTGPIPSKFDENHIIKSSSRFTFVLGRTGVYGEEDIPNVLDIQKGYILTPLKDFGHRAGSNEGGTELRNGSQLPLFPFIDKDELASDSPEPQVFFTYANFIMQYIQVETYEADLFERFRKLSIGQGLNFSGQFMSKQDYAAIREGIAVGSKKIDIAPLLEHFGNTANGWMGAVDPPIFGSEEVLRKKYATRAFAAKYGLYGADPQEAYYPTATHDANGDPLDSTRNGGYTLTFPAGQLPPVNDGGFWSITMYRLPQKLLVHNPIDRYSIGDRTNGLVYEDGSLTLYIQKDRPDTDAKVANWLPAPDPDYAGYESGLFSLTLRIYWPTEEALSAPYLPPGVIKASKALHSHI